jgi:hypothetical protein
MGIPENIAARKIGEEQAEFMLDVEAEHVAATALEDYWKPIVEGIPRKFLPIIPEKPIQPMTEQEAIQFERTKVPFGEHVGKDVSDVELRYLFWLAEQPDTFKTLVRRYLLSDRVQREQNAE